MKALYRLLFPVVVAAALSGCGGGFSIGFFDDDFGDDFEFDLRPFSTGRPGSVAVSAASEPALDGTYASADAHVSRVVGFFGISDTCRFRFDGLRDPTSGRWMAGEIRYRPWSFTVVTSIVALDWKEFRIDGGTGVALDDPSNAVVFSGAVLRSPHGSGHTVTLTGSVPMRTDRRPTGC